MRRLLPAFSPPSLLALFLTLSALLSGAGPAQAQLDLRLQSLDLPGPPVALLPADLDGDGRRDLAVVVAATTWEEISYEEQAELDGVDGLVEVLTVIPALFDRREVHAFLAGADGRLTSAGPALELPEDVLSVELGPPGAPLVALTDAGLAAIRLRGEEDELGETAAPAPAAEEIPALEMVPVVEGRPVLAGARTFVPGLKLAHDLDGDGLLDYLFPGRDGLVVYRGLPLPEPVAIGGEDVTGEEAGDEVGADSSQSVSGATPKPTPAPVFERAARLSVPLEERLPGDARQYRDGAIRHYPLPEVRDVTGDGLPDLLFANHQKRWNEFQVMVNRGGGRFGAAFSPLGGRSRDAEPEVVFFGDLDGDGRAEVVTSEEVSQTDDDASIREEMAAAKRPEFRYRFHAVDSELRMRSGERSTLPTEGYAFGQGDDVPLPGGFQDLNGDGRQDLVTLTLDFSLMKAMAVVASKRLTLDLDFHLWCQGQDGSFRRVPNLDLSGRFKINLNNLRLGQLSLFAGDFDGDGRKDFVQMGRGRGVSIHRGRADCGYPSRPDLTLDLAEEPLDLALVQVRDFDGDGRDDLVVTQPKSGDGGRGREAGDEAITLPVRLDLYLSGGAR